MEARLDVDAALEAVPEEFRTAVVLRDLADLDYAEIAEALAVPGGHREVQGQPGSGGAPGRPREPGGRLRSSK